MTATLPFRRMRLNVMYDGTEFHGSQRQPGSRTVQSELEQALDVVTERKGSVVFAGRTDRGVHARQQVISADLRWRATADELRDALNAQLPVDISVSHAESVDATFHARFDAQWREYRYTMLSSETPPQFALRRAWWRRDTLDVEAVQRAATNLEGRHGFGSFASLGCSTRRPPEKLERELFVCRWQQTPLLVDDWPATARYELRVVGDGFLPHMVRNIVGALVIVGRGLQPPEWLQSMLGASDRAAVGAAAPPQGLTLWQVGYDAFERGAPDEPAVANISLGV